MRGADAAMARLIDAVGPYRLRPERDRFGMLVRSILSQQISTGAARSIRAKLDALLAPDVVRAESLARASDDALRACGISPQKIGYLRSLVEKVDSGAVRLARIGRKPNEAIVTELVQVKGIGVWTAQMFLIFALGRLDVFPHGDLGVRVAIRDLYGLAALPTQAEGEAIARLWQPYASVASWYCWRSLDLRKAALDLRKGYPV